MNRRDFFKSVGVGVLGILGGKFISEKPKDEYMTLPGGARRKLFKIPEHWNKYKHVSMGYKYNTATNSFEWFRE